MSDDPLDPSAIAELKEATGDEFTAELVMTFLDEAPGMLDELKSAAARTDAEGYRRAAHSIKSNAATFGAREVEALARSIELGDIPGKGTGPEIDALCEAFGRASSALRMLIGE